MDDNSVDTNNVTVPSGSDASFGAQNNATSSDDGFSSFVGGGNTSSSDTSSGYTQTDIAIPNVDFSFPSNEEKHEDDNKFTSVDLNVGSNDDVPIVGLETPNDETLNIETPTVNEGGSSAVDVTVSMAPVNNETSTVTEEVKTEEKAVSVDDSSVQTVEEKGTNQIFDFFGVNDAKKEEENKEEASTADNAVSNNSNSSTGNNTSEERVVRYNPVTGEEMNINELKDEVVTGEKLKKVEIEYKPQSKFSSVMLVVFFLFMLGFILYLPDLTVIIDAYKSGRDNGRLVTEEIPSGRLVCTLETNTVNLDKSIERVFYYERLKLKSSKFSTTVRGDASLDEEALSELNKQCNQIKENTEGLDGISITCELLSDKLIEKESFDYAKYDSDKVSSAYSEAGGSMLQFEIDQDIDKIMSNMRQAGFRCNKEK